MDETSSQYASRLVAMLTSTTEGRQFRRAKRELQRMPAGAAVAALVGALRAASNPKEYDRAGKLLAEFGDDDAAEALAHEALSQKRFPRLAVRSLSLCDHPSVVPVLLEILDFAKIKQQRAAAYALARKRAGQAIRPLCAAVRKDRRNIGPDALEALHKMGNTVALARIALGEPGMTVTERVLTLATLEEMHPLLVRFWSTRFDAGRFLEREAAIRRSPVQDQARAASELWRQRETLLRASEVNADSAVLLRASGGPGDHAADALLRASDEEDEDEPAPRQRFAWLSGVFSLPLRIITSLMRR